MPRMDYLSILTEEVEALMDRHVERTGQAPRTILMPRSTYVVLEDYCLAREQEIYMDLLLKHAQAQGALQRRIQRKVRTAQIRMQQLRTEGIRFMMCKFGQIPVVVQPNMGRMEIQ